MLTVTLSAFACDGMEEKIRNAIRMISGGEDVEVEVSGDDQMVVRGFNGDVSEIAGTLYHRLVMRAHVVSTATVAEDEDEDVEDEDDGDDEEDDDDEEEEDDDNNKEEEDDDKNKEEEEDDGDDDDDDEDDDDESEDDGDTYLQMSSLSLYDKGLPATAIPEPSWEDQPIVDPTCYFYNV